MEFAQVSSVAEVLGEGGLHALYTWVYDTRGTIHADVMGDVGGT